MTFRNGIKFFVLAASVAAFGCSDAGTNTKSNSNAKAANTNAPANNSAVATTTPRPIETTNNAPTLTPFFKAYCLAMEKKDEAGIRKAYAKETLDIFTEQMKEDGTKSLVEFLSVDNVTTALCEIRNEEIKGNEAIAELKTAAIPNGERIVFVKEGNDWKLTNRSPALDAVKQTAPPASNSAAAPDQK